MIWYTTISRWNPYCFLNFFYLIYLGRVLHVAVRCVYIRVYVQLQVNLVTRDILEKVLLWIIYRSVELGACRNCFVWAMFLYTRPYQFCWQTYWRFPIDFSKILDNSLTYKLFLPTRLAKMRVEGHNPPCSARDPYHWYRKCS